jgi:hypothetical protein
MTEPRASQPRQKSTRHDAEAYSIAPMPEPFDWMVAKRNPEVVRAQKSRRDAMYRTELEDRAALLSRLGYAKDVARGRLQANARWDFEGRDGPVTAVQIDAIVDRVFGGAGTSKPGARIKGGAK